MVLAALDPVQADARNEQPFLAGSIDQAEADDGRGLAQQAQGVEPAPLAGILRPRQLHGPAELVANAFDEVLDLHRRQPGFCVQQVVQPGALVVIAEPRFAPARDQKRRDDRRKQGEKVLPEQRRAWDSRRWVGLVSARAPAGRPGHSITLSALLRSEGGKR